MTVRVVTDSAADIPADLAASKNVTVVPLSVRFGDESYKSGVELTEHDFWEKLKTSSLPPATAAPSAGDFQETFERLVAEGATGIVSVHLSSKLSATYQSAIVAAQEVKSVPIEVVDTLAVSAGTGLLALLASERADEGASAGDIATELGSLRDQIRLFGVLDTLEYLRRGGRIGGAQALLGTMLKVKPVISLQDGVVEPAQRVRTRIKALEYVASEIAAQKDKIDGLVVITGETTDTDQFIALLEPSIKVPASDVWSFGPIVGTHAGPGIIGVAFLLKP